LYQTNAVLTAFTFMVVGLGIKLAMFPLHFWLPIRTSYAPVTISAVMSATGAKDAAYALIRVMFTIFTPAFYAQARLNIQAILLTFAVAAILAGSVMALAQTDIKRMLAYSSIGQIGYIVLGIALMNVTGLIGALIHLLNHALMKGSLFFAVGNAVYKTGSATRESFKV
jgi:multicomponent Na+:H+ antiporter subunit D